MYLASYILNGTSIKKGNALNQSMPKEGLTLAY